MHRIGFTLCALILAAGALTTPNPAEALTMPSLRQQEMWGLGFAEPHPVLLDTGYAVVGHTSSESQTGNLNQYTDCSFGGLLFDTAVSCGSGLWCREMYFGYNRNTPGTAVCTIDLPASGGDPALSTWGWFEIDSH